MAKFTPRTTAPKKDNKYYYSNENRFYANGYGMPNCTAYAYGRLCEITGKTYPDIKGNAEVWWNVAEKAGLKRGSTPKLGAIICWRAGVVGNSSDGAGHVAVVEEIKANGDIVTSNSAWKGTEFYTQAVTKASGYQYASNRQFQGFIYCGIEFEDETVSSIKAGAKLSLVNTPSYNSATSSTVTSYRTGTYYVWSAEKVNGRIRITNAANRVGVAGQVTCWIDVPKTESASTSTSLKAGAKCRIKIGARDLNSNRAVAVFACLRNSTIQEVGKDYVVVSYKGVTIAKLRHNDIKLL